MSKKKVNEQCDGCMYWRALGSTAIDMGNCCHHLLDTGKRRERDGDKCLSRKEGKRVRRAQPFDVPPTQR